VRGNRPARNPADPAREISSGENPPSAPRGRGSPRAPARPLRQRRPGCSRQGLGQARGRELGAAGHRDPPPQGSSGRARRSAGGVGGSTPPAGVSALLGRFAGDPAPAVELLPVPSSPAGSLAVQRAARRGIQAGEPHLGAPAEGRLEAVAPRQAESHREGRRRGPRRGQGLHRRASAGFPGPRPPARLTARKTPPSPSKATRGSPSALRRTRTKVVVRPRPPISAGAPGLAPPTNVLGTLTARLPRRLHRPPRLQRRLRCPASPGAAREPRPGAPSISRRASPRRRSASGEASPSRRARASTNRPPGCSGGKEPPDLPGRGVGLQVAGDGIPSPPLLDRPEVLGRKLLPGVEGPGAEEEDVRAVVRVEGKPAAR